MQRALHFARYVDDCVTFVRSERAGKRVMEFSITRDRLPLDLFLPDQPNRHLRPCLGIARQGVDWTRTSGGVGGASLSRSNDLVSRFGCSDDLDVLGWVRIVFAFTSHRT